MSSEMLVLPFEGKGYLSATETQVVDRYGTEAPMRMSKDNVDFDSVTINGVAVAATGTLEVADITDITASAAEINVLDGIAATLTAAELSILDGVTATAAELNSVDVSAQAETVIAAGAASVTLANTKLAVVGGGAVTLAAPSAAMYGRVKTIEMTVDNGDVTLALTNVQGGSAATTATFAAVNDALILVGGTSKWHVIGESGVVLS